jgi:hypothetical protein
MTPTSRSSAADCQREAFPGAEVQILDESGHWPFIDQADHVEQLCIGFLERTPLRVGEPGPRALDLSRLEARNWDRS